jgi:FkbM family methyltransferase
MNIYSKLVYRFQLLTLLLDKPSATLLSLILKGGLVHLYNALDQKWFKDIQISCVIDIGANVGQFAFAMNKLLPGCKIYSFEPLPECFDSLNVNMKGITNFQSFNIGIGDQIGEIEFERNAYTPASSFLKTTSLNDQAYPFTSSTSLTKVPIVTLDDVCQNLEIVGNLLVKIDVQGFEDKVIRGARKILLQAIVVIIEVSFDELYQGQSLFDGIYLQMTELGFSYHGSIEQPRHPETGKIIQADCIFLRK